MENKAINEIRKFVRAGLVSLNTENMEDAQGNIIWTARAQKDRNKAKSMLNPEEIRTLEQAIASLGVLPKQCPNVPDTMLDLAGVRCLVSGHNLIFYKYNSSYNLVDILRVAVNCQNWLTEDHRGRFSLVQA
jgi:plasmid stabilization system protein ParE